MKLIALICASLGLLAEASAGKPTHGDFGAVARWQLNQARWGVLATTSLHLNGTAFGNPISIVDGLGDGTPYFFVSRMDSSIQDLLADPRCTVTISEASIDCQTLNVDPEDPRCVRLSLSGVMELNVTDKDESAKALTALYKSHPQMKSWPLDHNFFIAKLKIQKIWLIDYFGGAADVSIANYTASTPKPDMVPINASHVPSKGKPFFPRKIATARWLAHESTWGSIATTSIHLNGTAFANAISVADGTPGKSTGIPYFYVSALDTSMQDLKRYPKCTLSLSEASVDCAAKKLDPEDPRCVRLSLTGTIANVTDADELKFAKESLFAKHPEMEYWPASHDFHFTKLQIERIWLIDFFGGATDIAPKDYFAVKQVETMGEAIIL